jgi:hypothetical protein
MLVFRSSLSLSALAAALGNGTLPPEYTLADAMRAMRESEAGAK